MVWVIDDEGKGLLVCADRWRKLMMDRCHLEGSRGVETLTLGLSLCEPQRIAAMMTGYISEMVEEGLTEERSRADIGLRTTYIFL